MGLQYDFNIGNTPLIEVPQLSGRYGTRVSYKDESKNTASRTFKDRRNLRILERDSGIDAPVFYVQITYGNSGYSLGKICQAYERRTGQTRRAVHIVDKKDKRVPSHVRKVLGQYGEVIEVDLDDKPIPNHVLADLARKRLKIKDSYEIKPVETIGNGLDGYGQIIKEIVDEMARSNLYPGYIFCPVGEGELAVKLIYALRELGSPTKVIGVTLPGNVNYTGKYFDPRVTASAAEKLVCGYSDFREIYERLRREGGHDLVAVSDGEIQSEWAILRGLEIDAEPSAAAAFTGASSYCKSHDLSFEDNVVIVNTGNGEMNFESAKRSRRAKRLAAVSGASMLAGAALFGILHGITTAELKKVARLEAEDATQRDAVYLRKYMAEHPEMSDVYLYAGYLAEIGRYDPEVIRHISMCEGSWDNITRMICDKYPADRGEFNKWRREQRRIREQRLASVNFVVSEDSRELARNPMLNEIYAYALWRGGMSQIDKLVLSDLRNYFQNESYIRSGLYKIDTLRANVDGFNEWRRQQELAAKNGDTQIHR